jgi:hypothetical protein
MFKVSNRHSFFKSNYSIQIALFTHPVDNKIQAKLNAPNRRVETFTSADSLLRSDSKDPACRQEMLSHRMTMQLRREIAQHFDNLQKTNIFTEMTACEGT